MNVLVTGVAGFIGYHVARRLLSRGDHVVGIDNLNPYYDPALKKARLAELDRVNRANFAFLELDFADHEALERALADRAFDRIVHLGAQAGVRYSLENPRAYASSNLVGHLNMLELARARRSSHFVYASSSSVYGGNHRLPFSVEDRTDHPISLYASTKRADELMSETYSHLFRIPMTGLRFFTVYGPWGRPDMAMWIFTKRILAGQTIRLFNEGRMRRDFTYIDDIVEGVLRCLDRPPADDGRVKRGGSIAPHGLYNLGNSRSEELSDLLDILERACGRRAKVELVAMQPGDVEATFADITAANSDFGFAPRTTIAEGVPQFVDWFVQHRAQRFRG